MLAICPRACNDTGIRQLPAHEPATRRDLPGRQALGHILAAEAGDRPDVSLRPAGDGARRRGEGFRVPPGGRGRIGSASAAGSNRDTSSRGAGGNRSKQSERVGLPVAAAADERAMVGGPASARRLGGDLRAQCVLVGRCGPQSRPGSLRAVWRGPSRRGVDAEPQDVPSCWPRSWQRARPGRCCASGITTSASYTGPGSTRQSDYAVGGVLPGIRLRQRGDRGS